MVARPKPAKDEKGRFIAGNSGNGGRPKGSRNKLGEDFLTALADDFEEHGPAVIARVRQEKPEVYLKVVASILPKDINLKTDPLDGMTDEELENAIRVLNATLYDGTGNPLFAPADDDHDDEEAEPATLQ